MRRLFDHNEDVVPPPQNLEDKEFEREVSNMLNSLPPATARVCRLIYLDELKPEAAAAELGIAIQTIRNFTYDARKILRTKFKGYRKSL